jgi:hypothetical protein
VEIRNAKWQQTNRGAIKRIISSSIKFKQAQPWKWLYDADIICVENPKNKMMGCCSIMGKAGEHYALGVYLGNEGIFGFEPCRFHTYLQNAGLSELLERQYKGKS